MALLSEALSKLSSQHQEWESRNPVVDSGIQKWGELCPTLCNRGLPQSEMWSTQQHRTQPSHVVAPD